MKTSTVYLYVPNVGGIPQSLNAKYRRHWWTFYGSDSRYPNDVQYVIGATRYILAGSDKDHYRFVRI